MATIAEINSLESIGYKSKIKTFIWIILGPILFVMAFLNFYPVGSMLKSQLAKMTKGTACSPDFKDINIEWILPKVVITDVTLPPGCLGRESGESVKFNFVTLNWNIINFSPFGIPFRLDTEMSGQPLTVYYVLGLGQQMIRLKDQVLVLGRLGPLLGDKFKLAGTVKVDLNIQFSGQTTKYISLKAASNDLQIPSQSLEGFTLPNLKLNVLHIEASSENHPRIIVEKLFLGDTESPVRANFKGRIDFQEGNVAFSPLNLSGEVAFSESFKQTVPIIDLMFQSFNQKDGFYQIRLGGTLGAPKPSAL